jgi:hypothetical protein
LAVIEMESLDDLRDKLEQFEGTIRLLKNRVDFFDPIMFQQIGPSGLNLTPTEQLEASVNKSQKMIEAYQSSGAMVDKALQNLAEIQQYLTQLRQDLSSMESEA